jgi:predicted transcriptional regulator
VQHQSGPICVSIPGLSDAAAIGAMLGIPSSKVAEALEFLEKVGLASRSGKQYRIGTSRVFLKGDSPMIWKHHTNWRMKAIASFDRARADDLHLSTVFTASEEDLPKMKERILKAIEEVRGQIKTSREERTQCFSVDFFAV